MRLKRLHGRKLQPTQAAEMSVQVVATAYGPDGAPSVEAAGVHKPD